MIISFLINEARKNNLNCHGIWPVSNKISTSSKWNNMAVKFFSVAFVSINVDCSCPV